MRLTNNGNSPLGIPENPLLEPNQSFICLNWDQVKDNRIVQMWLAKGILIAGGEEPRYIEVQQLSKSEVDEIPANTAAVNEVARKDELIAKLAELGVNRDRRSSVERLEQMLEDALANNNEEQESE